MKYPRNKRRNRLRTITAFALSYLLLWGSYPAPVLAELVGQDEGTGTSTVVLDDAELFDVDITAQDSVGLDAVDPSLDGYVAQEDVATQDSTPLADDLVQDDQVADYVPTEEPSLSTDGATPIDITAGDPADEQPAAVEQPQDPAVDAIDIAEESKQDAIQTDAIELDDTTDDGLVVDDDAITVDTDDLVVEAAEADSIGIEEDYEEMGLTAQAAGSFEPAASNNVSDYHLLTDYMWALPSTSALYINSNGLLERVEYVDGNLIVETMASSLLGLYNARKTIDASTYRPTGLVVKNFVWGGFYAGSQYNFVVTGQDNPSKKDSLVVIRITKYDKSWKYLGNTEVTAAAAGNNKNTWYPFSEGYCDMFEMNGKLHVRTAHTMYGTTNVTGHQASLHLVVDEGTMKLADHSMKYTLNQKTEFGYVSHSFNQRLASLGNTLYSLDHGDANPRAITVKRIGETGTNSMKNLFAISGSSGINFTGVTMGGFETSSKRNTLLTAIASIDQNDFNSSGDDTPRNAYVIVSNADFSGTPSAIKLTNYKSTGKVGADIPKLVKINEDLYCVMWAEMNCGSNISWSDVNQRGKVSYIMINGKGEKQGSVQTINGYLSDCEPVLYGNLVTWYAENVTGDHLPVYYTIDYTTGLGSVPTFKGNINDATIATIANQNFTGSAVTPKPSVVYKGTTLKLGSDYEVSYTNNVNVGVATAVVTGINGYSGSQNVSFNIKSAQGTPTISASDKTVNMGETVTMDAKVTSGAGKLTYVSSNSGVATVDATTGKVTPKAVGDVTITIQSAENANWKPAKGSAKVTVKKGTPTITVSNKSLVATSTASLGAKASSGAGALSYASSNKAVVTVSSAGKLTPVKAGTAQVSVTSAANANWNSVTKKVTVTVTAAAQPLTVKATTKTAKAAAVKRKATVLAPLTVSKAQGTVTYAKASGSGQLSIDKKTGKVTVKKGTGKGTYTMTAKVTAAGTTKYKSGSKSVKITIKIT